MRFIYWRWNSRTRRAEGAPAPQEPRDAPLSWSETSHGEVTIGLGLERALDDADTAAVLDRLAGRYTRKQHRSEGRSTVLPSRSSLLYDGIKIKGAGLLGGTVDFSRQHTGAYDLPYYDYEGNYAPDKARASQSAFAGGMTYQQAVNEYRVSRYLTDHGFDTYPPLGYGYLRKADLTSWFCLLNVPYRPHWQWNAPAFDRHLVEEVPRFTARAQKRMRDLGLLLVLHGVTNIDGRLVRKDFHSARFHDPNDSFISRICYHFFDTNLVLGLFAHRVYETGIPGWVERAWCEYVGELCGDSPDYETVQAFKQTLLKLKVNDRSTLDERMEFIRNDAVARLICRGFMSEMEQRRFL